MYMLPFTVKQAAAASPDAAATAAPGEGGDLFGGWFGEAEKDPLCPTLGRRQRLLGFLCCLAAGVFCLSMVGIPALESHSPKTAVLPCLLVPSIR